MELIVKGEGTHFDPAVVDAFRRTASLTEQVAHESTDTAFTPRCPRSASRNAEVKSQGTDHSSAAR